MTGPHDSTLTFRQMLPHLLSNPSAPEEMTEDIYEYLSPVDRSRLSLAVQALEQLHAIKPPKSGQARGVHSSSVGVAFERVVQAMFDVSRTWTAKYNRRSLSAEFDVVLTLSPFFSTLVPMFKGATAIIMIEAKGHKSSPKTEWVNELMGLLSSHSSNMGLLVLANGNRKVEREMRMAIALHAQRNFFIVPLGRRQIDNILNGRSLLGVLAEQFTNASVHTTDLCI